MQAIPRALAAAVQKMGVEGFEAFVLRDRHQEVAPRVTNKAFNLALIVALAKPTEPILKQIVRLQLAEHACALPLAVTKNARHRDFGVVVQDRLRDPAKENCSVASSEGFLLRRLHQIIGRVQSANGRSSLRRIGSYFSDSTK
jgi:hypothetical protein